MTRRPKKITAHIIIQECRAGAVLHKVHDRRRVSFILEPPGLPVLRRHALAALASGKLVPMRDALFGGIHQSWRAAP